MRHFYVHEELKPGAVVETGEGFTMNGGDEDGHLFLVAADALRSKIVVKETDAVDPDGNPVLVDQHV